MSNSIQTLLQNACIQLANSSDTASLDAEVLLCHSLNKQRTYLRTWPERTITDEQHQHFQALITKRSQGIPVAYLTGEREFWSRNFKVSSDVLIPRPDSERLIELALNYLPIDKPCKVIDLGTGTGIIAITLAAERPLARIFACDICPKALNIAKENAQQHKINNIDFIESNWFSNISHDDFDVVISNPPYIPEDDPHLNQGDVRYEPKLALISAEQGLKDIRQLCHQAQQHLKQNGLLLIEHGYNQQQAVQAIFTDNHYHTIITHTDLSGQPRVTSGSWTNYDKS